MKRNVGILSKKQLVTNVKEKTRKCKVHEHRKSKEETETDRKQLWKNNTVDWRQALKASASKASGGAFNPKQKIVHFNPIPGRKVLKKVEYFYKPYYRKVRNQPKNTDENTIQFNKSFSAPKFESDSRIVCGMFLNRVSEDSNTGEKPSGWEKIKNFIYNPVDREQKDIILDILWKRKDTKLNKSQINFMRRKALIPNDKFKEIALLGSNKSASPKSTGNTISASKGGAKRKKVEHQESSDDTSSFENQNCSVEEQGDQTSKSSITSSQQWANFEANVIHKEKHAKELKRRYTMK